MKLLTPLAVASVAILGAFQPAHANGFFADVSTYVSTSGFSCLKQNGLDAVIIRGYQSLDHVDSNVAGNVRNAAAAGFKTIDIYAFPCARGPDHCSNCQTQAKNLLSAIQGLPYRAIWLDVEGHLGQWFSNDTNFNRAFIKDYVATVKAAGVPVGIYTLKSSWVPLTNSWDYMSELPLWYAHYDGIKDFSDFSSFGGWTKPCGKQYNEGYQLCGVGYDPNVHNAAFLDI